MIIAGSLALLLAVIVLAGISGGDDVTTIAPESLDWVTFSDEEEPSCEARERPCGKEAVVVAYYTRTCDCAPEAQRLCAEHRDLTIQRSKEACGLFACRDCGAVCRLVRMEPIR